VEMPLAVTVEEMPLDIGGTLADQAQQHVVVAVEDRHRRGVGHREFLWCGGGWRGECNAGRRRPTYGIAVEDGSRKRHDVAPQRHSMSGNDLIAIAPQNAILWGNEPRDRNRLRRARRALPCGG